VRIQLPDTVEALKQVPQLFQTAVRDAAEGRLTLKVEDSGVTQLRAELRRAAGRRDLALAAAVLWLSGLVCLALFVQYRWCAWVQMGAAVVLTIRYRSSRVPRG
jgi:hypothetical protein